MAIRVALHHRTTYKYDRPITLHPQVVRLRPAPHCRTPIVSYSIKVEPDSHFLNWQQDPQGNYLARLVFLEKSNILDIDVNLVADMTVINPFDFFLEPNAERFPFTYDAALAHELKPFLETEPVGPKLSEFLSTIDRTEMRTIDFLVMINQRLQQEIRYLIRMESGVQHAEQTLELRSGSCRDSAWLLVQALRNLGLAARFVSGYLIQLTADVKSLDGPSGPEADFTDLHAWTEVYLPGAGWVGLDPTSGLFAGEGHIPLACSPEPSSAAPVTGATEPAEAQFDVTMTVTRIHEDPRVTKPYTDQQWAAIEALGHKIDADLEANSVRLTMGGEPTFVSIDDMEGEEWSTAADSPTKRASAGDLIRRLRTRFANGGLLHFGQGKWYPGEQLPRWALGCYWRRDGVPIWNNPELFADERIDYKHHRADADVFMTALANRLGVELSNILPGYEDPWHYLMRERKLPANVDPLDSKVDDPFERERLSRVFEKGLRSTVGYALPLDRKMAADGPRWISGPWHFRSEHMFLLPGDSPMGYRLPLDSLPWSKTSDLDPILPIDPTMPLPPLPVPRNNPLQMFWRTGSNGNGAAEGGPHSATHYHGFENGADGSGGGGGPGLSRHRPLGTAAAVSGIATLEPAQATTRTMEELQVGRSAQGVIRTALCIEARNGHLYIFLPPARYLEDFLDLITAIEETAASLEMPIVLEGYPPPHDYRINHLKVTPDPGVIEVNLQPAHSWDELVKNTTGLYEDAHVSRLGSEKFMQDGKHTGTGGGNHIVLGGATPSESPFLRRPDLLRSLLAYWNNHPSLSYLFSGMFIGPTSQSPRIDEARHDSLYELELAFKQIPNFGNVSPWLVDRLFRNLLTDVTGNTHRTEFCIDKLYSPDTPTGRLGLVEMRAFEMPPHAQMSLTQQLLLRALVGEFWKQPYTQPLVRWGTSLHDRFMLPHFVGQDLQDVVADLQRAGYPMQTEWFAPHFEFRFPVYGEVNYDGVQIELRNALEPWHVLGEEPGAGGTARYVDSSIERLQVKVRGMTDPRHVVTCNGHRVPLHPTGTEGEFVAGVRYRAWQPPHCLHPTIGVHCPLVFDLVDRWSSRSIGGCSWHVSHPGGRSYDDFPVNANAADSRRSSRFFKLGHRGGPIEVPPDICNCSFPLTLDLRTM
ncbi:MAG: transglutaminase family protein [Planctomycetota bacterium]|nr:transglutaminase family protein [Planctomycetota bacterium]